MINYGIPTDEQWSKMQQFIKSDKYKKEDFFVFETQAVGDREVPGRFTKILPELLEVMKQDAQKGVSLMLNHNWSQLGVQSIPIGKVFDGRLGPGTQDGETTALYVSQYILRDDSKVDGYSKNDIINLIESGIMSDTSIGWGTDTECYICNICGHQYYGPSCDHYRGAKYTNEETNEVKQCIVEVHAPKNLHAGNNVLMENSVVFDGAYPNAQIQSSVAIQNATSNNGVKLLDEKEELSENQKIYANSCNNHLDLYYIPFEKGGKAMEEKEMLSQEPEVETTEEVVEETTTEEVQAQSNEPEAETTEEVTETTTDEAEATTEETQSNDGDETEVETPETNPSVETQSAISFEASELSEIFGEAEADKEMLLRLAKDGKMYRDNVINEALKSGVRTLGNSFNKETFAKTFELMSTEDIKAMGEAWEKEVSEKFSFARVSKDTMSKDSSNNSSEVDYSFLKTSTY